MAQIRVLEPELPLHVIHQFPMPTFIENISIRPNGKILVTVVNTFSLMMVDPQEPSTATLVHTFKGATAITGIVEVEHDIYYVGAGNIDMQAEGGPKAEIGSWSIWKVDMNSFETSGEAKVERIASVPKAHLPNGFESLPNDKTCVLFADCVAGNLIKVDIKTGTSEILMDLEEMKPTAEGMQVGINGIKHQNGYMYWTSSVKELFCRIKIDDLGNAIGKVEILARGLFADDFALDTEGNAWITTHHFNTVVVVKTDGEIVQVAGKVDQMTLAGSTACLFGRGKDDGHFLYVTTCGGLTGPVDGKVEGGKIVAVDMSKF